MAQSRGIIALAAILIIIVAVFAVYAAITYPRAIVTIPVSFTIGADAKTVAFDQPFLNDEAQVTVAIENGEAFWRAQITNQDQLIWEHEKGQGEQTSYNSAWIQLPSGSYNFTFRTIGIGSLEATVTVTSKGGFW